MLLLYSFVIVTGCVARAQDLFYFSKSPENRDVISGAAITLPCEVSHPNSIIYYWHLNDTKLSNTTRRHQVGSNLRITSVDRFKDAGEFSCIAENVTSRYSLTSSAAQLQILWIGKHAAVQLQAPSAEQDITPGGEVHLRCTVNGTAEIKHEWTRNGLPLGRTERVLHKGRKLILRDVSSADNGVYQCTGSNEAGRAESRDGFLLKLPGPGGLLVKTPPRDVLAKRGDTVRLDCQFEKAHQVQWQFLDESPRQDLNRRTTLANGTLILSKMKPADQGRYLCTASQKTSSTTEDIQSYSARIIFSYIENLTVDNFTPRLSTSVLLTPQGRPFEITCDPPKGVPAPVVTWQDNQGRNLSDTGLVRTDDGRLVLESPSVDTDSGNYTCLAENMAGTRRFTIELVVTVAPVPLMPAEGLSVTREEGQHLRLSCPYRGSPYPATRVKWQKDDKYLNLDRHFYSSRPVVHDRNGTLDIESVQPSDRGIYACEMSTAGFPPVLSKPFNLIIIEKLKFAPKPVSKRLELGTTAKIPCKVQGTPSPSVHWFVGGKPLPGHVHDVNGTLHFDTVHATDKGFYTCVAISSQGSINATVEIDVIVSPRFSVKPQNPTEAVEGHQVMLHCAADGDPKPTIRWDKNGSLELESQRFQVLENGTLVVQDVHYEDMGKYGCTAGNSGGLKREEAILVVRSVAGGLEDSVMDDDDSMMTKTVTITLSAAAGYMVLVIGLMVWCRMRRRRRKQAYLNANPEGILLAKAENGDAVGNGDHHGNSNSKGKTDCKEVRRSDGAETAHSQSSGQSRRSTKSTNYDKLAFPRNHLRDLKLIGHGMFGQVVVGRAEGVETPVAVKSLQNTRDEVVLAEFKRELDMFHRLAHDNVVKVVGLCREMEPHYLILEYTDWGDLKHFLQTTRKERGKLSTAQIVDLAKQVSLAMEHLSNSRFVHKDLAARNILVGSDLKAKLSLLALSKDVSAADYVLVRNQVVPLRWLPLEAVFEDDYSTKSDVYSFAALCWELFHQGERPFPNVPDSVLVERLQRREVAIKPSKNAPSKMAALLSSCILSSPKDRPTFSNIAIVLGEVLNEL